MSRTCILVILLAVALCSHGWSQQDSADSPSHLFGRLSSKDLDAVRTARQAAYAELAKKAADFKAPPIDAALVFSPTWKIAIARITSVQLPSDASGRTIVAFHVEQLLNGKSRVRDFKVESRWNPRKPKPELPPWMEDP